MGPLDPSIQTTSNPYLPSSIYATSIPRPQATPAIGDTLNGSGRTPQSAPISGGMGITELLTLMIVCKKFGIDFKELGLGGKKSEPATPAPETPATPAPADSKPTKAQHYKATGDESLYDIAKAQCKLGDKKELTEEDNKKIDAEIKKLIDLNPKDIKAKFDGKDAKAFKVAKDANLLVGKASNHKAAAKPGAPKVESKVEGDPLTKNFTTITARNGKKETDCIFFNAPGATKGKYIDEKGKTYVTDMAETDTGYVNKYTDEKGDRVMRRINKDGTLDCVRKFHKTAGVTYAGQTATKVEVLNEAGAVVSTEYLDSSGKKISGIATKAPDAKKMANGNYYKVTQSDPSLPKTITEMDSDGATISECVVDKSSSKYKLTSGGKTTEGMIFDAGNGRFYIQSVDEAKGQKIQKYYDKDGKPTKEVILVNDNRRKNSGDWRVRGEHSSRDIAVELKLNDTTGKVFTQKNSGGRDIQYVYNAVSKEWTCSTADGKQYQCDSSDENGKKYFSYKDKASGRQVRVYLDNAGKPVSQKELVSGPGELISSTDL